MISSGLHFGMHIEEEETSRFSSILSSVFDVSTETRSGICVCVCFFFFLRSAFLFPLVFFSFTFSVFFCHSFPLCFAAFHCFLSAFSSHDVSIRLAEAGDSAALFGLLKAYLVQEKLMYVVPLMYTIPLSPSVLQHTPYFKNK